MTESILPGKTEWETREYLRDHGHRIAAAQAYGYLGHLIETSPGFPLPAGAEEVIAAAAAAMEGIASARRNAAEASLARIHAAVDETVTAMQPERGAA